LCAYHWDRGGGPVAVTPEGADAAAALDALGLPAADGAGGDVGAATVAGDDTVPRAR
jgi:hypothetical protein